MLLPLVDSPILSGSYWKTLLTLHTGFFRYCYTILEFPGPWFLSFCSSKLHTEVASPFLSNTALLGHRIYAWLLYEYLKMPVLKKQ